MLDFLMALGCLLELPALNSHDLQQPHRWQW